MLAGERGDEMDAEGVNRVALPSGGWWDLLTRPRWGDIGCLVVLEAPGGEEVGAPATAEPLLDLALIALTDAWSFGEPVNAGALADREPADVTAVVEVLGRELLPRWLAGDGVRPAEALFEGLVAGRVPRQFAEVHMMAQTGWSWAQLQQTPADVVERMAVYLAVTEARRSGGAVDMRDEYHAA